MGLPILSAVTNLVTETIDRGTGLLGGLLKGLLPQQPPKNGEIE